MADERTLVLLEDIAVTDRMEAEAKKLGGYLEITATFENSALFHFPSKGAAHDFIFVARQQGYQASIIPKIFPVPFRPLDALREDAERIRRMLKKPMARPPWGQ